MKEDSILHVVRRLINDTKYERIMEENPRKEEIELPSPTSPSEVKECEYGMTVIDSIVKHILGQELLQTGSTFKIDSFEEVHYALSSHPNKLLHDDHYLLDVINLLSDPNSYIDYPKTKQLIVEKVESYLGFPVQFSVEYVRVASEVSHRIVA